MIWMVFAMTQVVMAINTTKTMSKGKGAGKKMMK